MANTSTEDRPVDHLPPAGPTAEVVVAAPASTWWQPVLLLVGIMALLVLARLFGLGEKLGSLR